MENSHPPQTATKLGGQKARIFFASLLSLFLQGAFFYYLVKQQFQLFVKKQAALEAIKAIAVPGTAFLNSLGGSGIFKSSLFYLILLGMIFLAFLFLSLLLKRPWTRALFLLIGLLALTFVMKNDRLNLSFPLVICLSFASFYLLTLPCRITFSLREAAILVLLMVVLTGSLYYGTKKKFFLKTRDRVLFGSTLGNHVISFYYTNSTLAAGLISPARGIYEGLVVYGELENEKYVYLGDGLFLSGKKELEGSADFVITRQEKGFFITNKFGKGVPIEAVDGKAINGAINRLFSMGGLVFLSKIALYFFPAGLLILPLMGLRCVTENKKIFIFTSAGLASVLVLFIFYMSATGNHPPRSESLNTVEISREGLSIAYYLQGREDVPEAYFPAIKKMATSDSPALRYWGANLLGRAGVAKEAKTLMALLSDSSLNVRYEAAQSLYRLLDRRSFVPLLQRLLTDPSWYVRCKIFSVFLRAGMIPSQASSGQSR